MMQIREAHLNSSRHARDPQLLNIVASPMWAPDIGPHHLGSDRTHASKLVYRVVLELREWLNLVVQWPLARLDTWCRPLNHRHRLKILPLLPPLENTEYARAAQLAFALLCGPTSH